ncbi:MAG TPA: class I SAM-dependent methyltransferase [Candidatus Sulfopaludibacter sp.]|jgi:methyltransferase (TIGR00027 family)|nr:class I SAM-dependent methyltransferase [Candidatus Sulfopaludibacter sp.]
MSPASGEINHVSDTALMVAACRALEAECPDGFVHDPFAARLAGDRGRAILEALPRAEMMRFGIAIRSHFLDELLLASLASGAIATVLSVGCGLDTRPWRMDLPADLRWIEVDFADMLDYKDALMSGETPHCRRERLTVDLNDPSQRRTLYTAAGSATSLMITEGLLMYLPAATVEALAAESARESAIAHWIIDITSSGFSKAIQMDTYQQVRNVQPSDFLHGEDILECLHRHGWATEARRSYITDMGFAMERIGRMMANSPRPAAPPPFAPDDPTGVHYLTRA